MSGDGVGGSGLMKPASLTCPVIQGLGGYRIGQGMQSQGLCQTAGAASPLMGGVSSPIPPMPNLVKHASLDESAGPDDVKVKTAKAAGNIVTHVDDLLGALAEMHEVNKFWKDKYLQVRSDHINKYVPTGNTRIQERMFHAWKGYVFQAGNVERLQALKARLAELQEDGAAAMEERENEHKMTMKRMQASHEAKLEEVARTIEEQNQQCQQVLREREYYEDREQGSGNLLKEMKGLLENTPERSYAVGKETTKELSGNFEYSKQFLHDILNEVDPKYVPPVGSLCVSPSTGQIGVWQPAPPMRVPQLRVVDGQPNSPNAGNRASAHQGIDREFKRKWLAQEFAPPSL